MRRGSRKNAHRTQQHKKWRIINTKTKKIMEAGTPARFIITVHVERNDDGLFKRT
jgi:hypothetical protein